MKKVLCALLLVALLSFSVGCGNNNMELESFIVGKWVAINQYDGSIDLESYIVFQEDGSYNLRIKIELITEESAITNQTEVTIHEQEGAYEINDGVIRLIPDDEMSSMESCNLNEQNELFCTNFQNRALIKQ